MLCVLIVEGMSVEVNVMLSYVMCYWRTIQCHQKISDELKLYISDDIKTNIMYKSCYSIM